MASAGIQTRSMRKTVARVDVGVFGYPMRAQAWLHARNGSVGGKIGLMAAKAALGLLLFLLTSEVVGVPANPLSVLFAIGFMIGSVIGGPFSFWLWSLLAIEASGLIAGFAAGAWVGFPSWWHTLAADWRKGSAIPVWFVIAVPVWMFVWIASGRLIAKACDMLLDKFALRLSFKAARRFMSTDDKLRQQAFEETKLSEDEARRTLDVIEHDSTHAVIVGEQPKIYQTEQETKDAEETGSFHSLLQVDDAAGRDEAVLQAASGAKFRDSMVETAVTGAVEGTGAAIFLQTPGLPAIPPVEEPPVQKAESPKLDARANRAMTRHMNQLMWAFEQDNAVDEVASFIARHRNVLMNLSEDQQRMLDTMENGPAIIEISRQLREENAVSYLTDGPSQKAGIDMSLLEAAPEVPSEPGISMVGGSGNQPASDATVEQDAFERERPQAEAAVAPSVAPPGPRSARDMAGVLSSLMAASSQRRNAQAADVRKPSYDDLQGAPQTSDAVAAADPAPTPSEAESADETATASIPALVSPEPLAITEGEYPFDVDLKSRSGATDELPEQGDTETPAEDHEIGAPAICATEKKMVTYSQEDVYLVRGLLAAQKSPQEKARQVLAFQAKYPHLVVADVIASRAFSDAIGDIDAASVRHSWRSIQALIATPPSERLGRDFDRLNERGTRLIDDPQTLTEAAYNHWDQESSALRQQISNSADLRRDLMDQFRTNVALGDSMKEILDARATHAKELVTPAGSDLPVVRQKIVPREQAERGHGVLTKLFAGDDKDGRERSWPLFGTRQAAEAVESEEEGVGAELGPQGAASSVGLQNQEDMVTEQVVELQPGDEGFVSKHPEGSIQFRKEMAVHEGLLSVNRELAEEAARQAEREREQEEARLAALSEEEARSVASIRAAREAAAVAESEARVRAAAADAEAAELRRQQAVDDARTARVAAELAEKNLRETAVLQARTALESMVLAASQKVNANLFQIPSRFQTPEIIEAYVAYEEISTARPRLVAKVPSQVPGLDANVDAEMVARIRSDNSQRSLVQFEVVAGEAAAQVMARIAALVDATDLETDAIAALLSDNDEISFVYRIGRVAESGKKAIATLERVAEIDRERERLADGAAGLDGLNRELLEYKSRVTALFEEKSAFTSQIEEAQRDRDTALAEVARLKREITGEIDDEFQKVLDSKTERLTDIGINGVYRYKKPSGTILILTARASAFPDGMVSNGHTSMTLVEAVERLVDMSSGLFSQGEKEVIYVDPNLRAYLGGSQQFSMLHCDRDAEQLNDVIGKL